MLISHRELEQIKTDLRGWVRKKQSGQNFIRAGYHHMTRMAIYFFHKTGDRSRARAYLRDRMNNGGLKNKTQRAQALAELDAYIEWYHAASPIVARCQVRIRLTLSREVQLSGEIPRVDVETTSDGYRAVLLGYGSDGWQRQLRIPLIQRAIGRQLDREEQLIEVAVQELDGSGLHGVMYRRREIDRAYREAQQLTARAVSMLRP